MKNYKKLQKIMKNSEKLRKITKNMKKLRKIIFRSFVNCYYIQFQSTFCERTKSMLKISNDIFNV
jgi:hypothetical protein